MSSATAEFLRLKRIGLSTKEAIKANMVAPNGIELLVAFLIFASVVGSPFLVGFHYAIEKQEQQARNLNVLLQKNSILKFENSLKNRRIEELEKAFLSCLNNKKLNVDNRNMQCIIKDWEESIS